MQTLQDLSPKEADAFTGSTMDEVTTAMVILEYELHKLSLIRRAMMAKGSMTFEPTEHGIDPWLPHSMC